MRRHRTSAAAAAVLLSFSLVAAACGDDDEASDTTGAAEPGTTGAEPGTTGAEPGTTGAEPGTTGAEPGTTAGGGGGECATSGGAEGGTTDTTAAGSDGTETTAAATDTTASGFKRPAGAQAGGEIIDVGTLVGDPPEHIDPGLNVTLDAYQLVNAMYDGLTDIDAADPADVKIQPHVADEVTPNEDGSVWTFHIREGAQFSDGEEINASTFLRSWERAAALGGDYSYLFNFLLCGEEVLAGDRTDFGDGAVADDATRTLTVTLSAPYANFDAVASFQLFFPMPEAANESPEDYENGMMVGNGPYTLESPRTDEEIVLVKNDNWQGDFNGETWDARLDTLTFRAGADPDTGFNALEAGEADIANIPPTRAADAEADWGTSTDVKVAGSYYYRFNDRSEIVGGPDNKLLRQAISQAIDRDAINEAAFAGLRVPTTGIVPPGIPGHIADMCDYCAYDPEAAQTAFEEWTAAGNALDGPIPIQFNIDAGHEPVVDLVIEDLNEIGIEAERDGRPSETYFTEMADGDCVFCRSGWYADYPTYDNFMYDLFHSDALDGNNYGFINEEFDGLVDEAKQTTDAAQQAELFNQAEDILLNDDINAVPINWYVGDYVYDQEKLTNFPQNAFGLIAWEQIVLAS